MDPLDDRLDLCSCVEIEDKHALGVRIGRQVVPTCRELKFDLTAWNFQKDAVIAIVALKLTGLAKTDQISIERHYLLEPVRVPGKSNLH
jgi:hypothetical protein